MRVGQGREKMGEGGMEEDRIRWEGEGWEGS